MAAYPRNFWPSVLFVVGGTLFVLYAIGYGFVKPDHLILVSALVVAIPDVYMCCLAYRSYQAIRSRDGGGS